MRIVRDWAVLWDELGFTPIRVTWFGWNKEFTVGFHLGPFEGNLGVRWG